MSQRLRPRVGRSTGQIYVVAVGAVSDDLTNISPADLEGDHTWEIRLLVPPPPRRWTRSQHRTHGDGTEMNGESKLASA